MVECSMNGKLLVIMVLLCSFCVFFTGCDEPNTNHSSSEDVQRFVGMWNTSEPIQWYIKPSFTFYENQSFAVDKISGTYDIINDSLILTWNDEQQTELIYGYHFMDNDTVDLTYIASGDQGIYKRQ
jgi:hypothetical protein